MSDILRGLIGSNASGTSLLSDPLFMTGLGLLQSGSQPGATVGSSLLPAVTSGIANAQTFGKIERQNKFDKKISSGEEITEIDVANAYPETYAEYKIKSAFAKADPFTPIAKLNADFANELITEEQYRSELEKETGTKEWAPGEAEKYVKYAKTINDKKTEQEHLNDWVKLKTSSRKLDREGFISEAYRASLTAFSDTKAAKTAAEEAGKFYDEFLGKSDLNSSSFDITSPFANDLISQGYTNFSFDNEGRLIATDPDGTRGYVSEKAVVK